MVGRCRRDGGDGRYMLQMCKKAGKRHGDQESWNHRTHRRTFLPRCPKPVSSTKQPNSNIWHSNRHSNEQPPPITAHQPPHLLAQVPKACEFHKAAKLHDAGDLAAVHCTQLRVTTLLLLVMLLLGRRWEACSSSRCELEGDKESRQEVKRPDTRRRNTAAEKEQHVEYHGNCRSCGLIKTLRRPALAKCTKNAAKDVPCTTHHNVQLPASPHLLLLVAEALGSCCRQRRRVLLQQRLLHPAVPARAPCCGCGFCCGFCCGRARSWK